MQLDRVSRINWRLEGGIRAGVESLRPTADLTASVTVMVGNWLFVKSHR
jgi:hypothetical protein